MQVVGAILALGFCAFFIFMMYKSALKTEQRKAEQGERFVTALEQVAKNTKK